MEKYRTTKPMCASFWPRTMRASVWPKTDVAKINIRKYR